MSKAYQKYKPSGVEWLGDVPEHWVVASLRHLFIIKAGGDLKEDFYSEEKTALHIYPIYTNSIKSDEAYGYTSRAFFKANSITVTGRGEIGYAVYRDHEFDAIIRLLVLTPKNSTPCKYYAYFINTMLEFFGGSTAVSQLSTEQISPYKVFSPPLSEQQAIAAFLDRETGRIDALIAKKQRLLELLAEQRTALISRAVTRGLDASVKLKPSGVEWLGDVPEHWEVKRLKNAFTIFNGSTPESSKEEYWDGDIVWFTPEDLGNNNKKIISDSRRKITKEGYSSIGAKIVPPKSIIISTRAPIGHLAVASVSSCTNQGCRSLVTKNGYSADFYYYYLFSSKNNLNAIGKGTTFIELGTQGLGSYSVPFPPLHEQQAIAAFLDSETAKIDALSAKVTTVIERLKEYRTALISSAVTGKIDVREAV